MECGGEAVGVEVSNSEGRTEVRLGVPVVERSGDSGEGLRRRWGLGEGVGSIGGQEGLSEVEDLEMVRFSGGVGGKVDGLGGDSLG